MSIASVSHIRSHSHCRIIELKCGCNEKMPIRGCFRLLATNGDSAGFLSISGFPDTKVDCKVSDETRIALSFTNLRDQTDTYMLMVPN